jgi:ATP-binding protein involved in chromosome partitioning
VTQSLKTRVEQALAGAVPADLVHDLAVDEQGAVSFTFVLARDHSASLARNARKAAQGVDGVTAVKVNVVEAPPAPPGTPAPARAPAVPPPPTPDEMPALGKVLAVSSGKGGVGKSTVSANLAAALARQGHRVGLMDADIYGPNIPRMFGVDTKPEVQGGKIQPLEAHGVKLMSLGFIVERDAPAIWRGPIIMKIIQQFLRDVAWGELDYFFVDLPPGTGDAQLSLSQLIPITGAVMVTTPQDVSIIDVEKAMAMWKKVEVPVIGVVENMSGYVCPSCGHHDDIFSRGGGRALATRQNVPFLGEVPIDTSVRGGGDSGKPIVLAAPDSPVSQTLRGIARTVACALSVRHSPEIGKRSGKLTMIR